MKKDVLTIASLLAVLIASTLLTMPEDWSGFAHYAPLHVMFECVAIIVSVMLFSVVWGTCREQMTGGLLVLAVTFIGVAILDFQHMLAYVGMPDYFGSNTPEKAINFWLSARFLAAIGLLCVAFLREWQLPDLRYRWLILAVVIFVVAYVSTTILACPDSIPRTFIEGQGLTRTKIIAEYLLIAIYMLSAIPLYFQIGRPKLYYSQGLFTAAVVMAMSEFFFTLYGDVTDIYNTLGHIYKVIAYGFIYFGVFMSNIRRPYEELSTSRQLLSKIVDSLPGRIFWKDRDLRYLGANKKFARDAGFDDPEALIGLSDDRLPWKAQSRLYQTDDRKVIESGESQLFYEEPQYLDSGLRWVRTSKVPLKNATDKTIGVLGVYVDITEEKRKDDERQEMLHKLQEYREQLEELVQQRTEELEIARDNAESSNRAKSIFLANMSHELRTPLTSVIGFSRIMGNDPDLTPDHKHYLDIINRSASHLLTLINDILDFSKIESGKLELKLQAMSLTTLIQDVTDMLRARAEQTGIELQVKLSGLPDAVLVDGPKLRQVLLNLLSNAIKFTHEGSVTLLANGETKGGLCEVEFHVIDTGVGIEPDDQQRVFEPFVQITHEVNTGGTGLGLVITKQYLELMGSQLHLHSTPGKGTTFNFNLKLALAGKDELEVLEEDASPLQFAGYSLLIADDVADVRLLLKAILRPLGFTILEAENGDQARLMVEQHSPQILLLDWEMPGTDGLSLVRELRQRKDIQCPVILLMSAHSFDEDRQQALDAGADDYLSKPIEQTKLKRLLRKHAAAIRRNKAST